MSDSILKIAIGLFVLGAVFGLIVLAQVLKNKPTPKLAVISHGIIVATALLLVLIFCVKNPQHAPTLSLVLFVIAALGGFTMLSFDLRRKVIPKVLALAHPVIAVIALLALIGFVVST